MPVILKGAPAAEALRQDISGRAMRLIDVGVMPKIAILRAGQRSDDLAYERQILNICKKVHIESTVLQMDADVKQNDFEANLVTTNWDPRIHGILVFRPMPRQIDEERIQGLIYSRKDIDCMNPENLQYIFVGDEKGVPPCTPEAVIELLKFYQIDLRGKNVVIVNRSLVLGRPLAMLFLNEDATVTICHSKTEDLPSITRRADIVVTGIGRAGYFGPDYFSEHSIVVDVGINFEDGKMCGDVDYDAVADKVQAITPVPGGVGIVTTTLLLRHTIESAESALEMRHRKERA